MFRGKTIVFFTAFAMFTGFAQGADYLPVGPQQNVPVSTVTSGGWTECYRDTYDNSSNPTIASIQTACTGTRLMLACVPTGGTTLQLLAQAERADVFTDTTNDSTTTHTANGSEWYFHSASQKSWGFVKAGETVNKNSCDVLSGTEAATRLCWHTSTAAPPDSLGYGYRCGANIGLNNDNTFERIVYSYTATPPAPALPVPANNNLMLLFMLAGLVFIGAIFKKRVRS